MLFAEGLGALPWAGSDSWGSILLRNAAWRLIRTWLEGIAALSIAANSCPSAEPALLRPSLPVGGSSSCQGTADAAPLHPC